MTFFCRSDAFSSRSGARLLVAACLTLVGAMPASISAQATVPRTMISINPLGLPFKYVSGELEQKVNSFATIGGSVSYIDISDGSYASFEGKFRLYPNEEAFQGFSIGVAAGITRIGEDVTDANGQSHRSATNPTIAVIADYNWLIGKTKRVLVGTGVGAKRIFGSENGFSDVNFAYPTVRFQVGVTF